MLYSLVNGEETDFLPVNDRSVLYGDALFETIAIKDGTPLLLEQHISRLSQGVEKLGFDLDFSLLAQEINQALEAQTNKELSQFVLRLTISRGGQGRGYMPAEDAKAQRMITIHAWPNHPDNLRNTGVSLAVSEVNLSSQVQLAGMKHANRLEQILASQALPAGFDDALMLDQQGKVVCTTKSNVFVLLDGTWLTNELIQCGIAGVMRDAIGNALYTGEIELTEGDVEAPSIGYASLSLDDIYRANEVFICNSLVGVLPVRQIDHVNYNDFTQSHKMYHYLQSVQACV